MRQTCFLFAAAFLLLMSCSPIEKDHSDLQPMLELPTEYGTLVSVTQHFEDPEWYELWFCNEETGVITHIPLYRTTWAYNPQRVRRIERTDTAAPPPAGGQP